MESKTEVSNMENTDSERSRVCLTWKPEEAGISRASPAYSVHFRKICHAVGHACRQSLLGTTELMFIEPGVKINGAYYRDVLLGQHLLPVIRSVAGDFFTYNAPAHRAGDTVEFLSGNTPDFISPLPWAPNSTDLNPVHYEVWGMLQQRVYHSRIRDVDHLKQRLIEEWRCLDQNIIDRAVRQWRVRLRACVRANGGHFEHKL